MQETAAYWSDVLLGLLRVVWTPIVETPWTDLRGFWLQRFVADRFLVLYALPLVAILLFCKGDGLRRAIVGTGLVFIAYVFGPLYMALWFATCAFFFLLGEWYARVAARGGIVAQRATWFCGVVVVIWYAVGFVLGRATGSRAWNAWIFEHAAWLLPLGVRGAGFEPDWSYFGDPPSLLRAAFRDVHLCGTAYLAVRLLHYFAELRRSAIPDADRSLLRFLAYTCYAPNYMQGPIERYHVFHKEIDTCHERRGVSNLLPAARRFALGMTQGLTARLYFEPLLHGVYGLNYSGPGTMRFYDEPGAIESFAALYFGAFVQIFTLYLYFAGYCNFSAGMARLIGYRQIENFAMPWRAASLRDFWRRWHISLSSLLRDYIYIPLGGNRRRVFFNMCATFAICGVWHGPLPQLLFWGVLMGAMVWVNHAWYAATQSWLAASNPGGVARLYARWHNLPVLPWVCRWLLTQHAFVFSLLVFFGGAGGLRVAGEIIRRAAAWFW